MSDGRRIDVAIRHRIGALALDVAFTLTQPWTVLFAPSGAGKSTILHTIAGLVSPDAGRITYTSPAETIVLTDTDRGVSLPPHRRHVRLVTQQASLFPHRTVLQNILYGTNDRERANDLLKLCRIAPLADKMPSTLSGGERQRAAIARALGPANCHVLLLDEPFTGLDMPLRDDLIDDLKRWIDERHIPVLQVTHDVGEVFALGADVIRLKDGRVTAHGPARDVLRSERQTLLAQL